MRIRKTCAVAACLGALLACDDGATSAPMLDQATIDAAITDAAPVETDGALDARVPDATPRADAQVDAAPDDAALADATLSDAAQPDAGPPPGAPNLLLIIADDYGLDWAACYGAAALPDTPTINALCARGLVFENAWANPVCSPTRATALTGRYAVRTGIGSVVGRGGLDMAEFTLPQALAGQGYASALIGKWHLGGALTAPNDFGFDHFAGLFRGALPDYSAWTNVVDGAEVEERAYATTVQVDRALAWLDQQQGPWFLQMAFTAPHSPFHAPPNDLHRVALGPDATDTEKYHAMIEALDTELARLLAGVDRENTVVVFIGDNGSPRQVARAPVARDRAKDTLYEGGIHVPMIVAGPGVVAGRTESLANVTDLWRTFVDLAGGDDVADDAVSLRPIFSDPNAEVRQYLRSDLFGSQAGNGRTVRDATHKLIQFDDGTEALYDLTVDPWERMPLDGDDPALRVVRDRLLAELDRVMR